MINGRRRDHGAERAHLELLEAGAPVKCNPLAWWEFKDCWDYIDQQKLQYHPLHDEVSPDPFSTLKLVYAERRTACSFLSLFF